MNNIYNFINYYNQTYFKLKINKIYQYNTNNKLVVKKLFLFLKLNVCFYVWDL